MLKTVLSQVPYQTKHQLHIVRDKQKYRNIREHQSGHLFNIFDKYQCLFVHIPKTGGVSVYSSLFAAHDRDVPIKSAGHFTLRDYNAIFGESTLQKYYTFTFVRNPWSRLLSSYQFLKKGGFHSKDKAWAAANLAKFESFNDFVMQWLTPQNIQKSLHLIPQHEFVYATRSHKGTTADIDFIGRLENIETDFGHIKHRLGLDCQLQHRNKTVSGTKKPSYRESYTPEAREIVAQVYRKDIELFDYTF